VVQRVGRPALRHQLQPLRRSCGSDHGHSVSRGELDGGQADAAARAVHQHDLAGKCAAPLEQRSSNTDGGAAVADYLVANDKTRVAFIGGADNASTSRERGRGFLDRMAERGHAVPEHFRFQGGFSHDISAQVMKRLLSRADRPQAVFCANDLMAFGALDALRASRVQPQDCWIIGYDDVEMASWDSFSLTTVRQPSREMARIGARLLVERIHSPGLVPRRVNFPCDLIVRGSTELA
jgi:LacI family transcriptional regulator